MKELTLDFIIQSCDGEKLGTSNPIINKIVTDSREAMNNNTLFIALKGEKHDGHKFVQDAFNKGACAAIVSDKNALDINNLNGKSIIVVDDTLTALQNIAKSYRQQFNIPIVAITGSVGKTTTKEILSCLLNGTFNTLYTEGNFNNDIGLPLTIFRMENSHEAAVVEMAMRARGEISRLADIARPSCAIITNVEPVHLETLGSLENIARAKCEVLETLTNKEFALINGDNDLLVEIANTYPCKKYTFGYNQVCDCKIVEVSTDNTGINIKADIFEENVELFFPVPAPKLAINVVAAAAVAFLLGVDLKDIVKRIEGYKPAGSRLKMINLPEGGLIIDDTYNANPVSMQAALETANKLKGSRRFVAVLGDMYELGNYERKGHYKVGALAAQNEVDLLLTVGSLAYHIAEGAINAGMDNNNVYHFNDKTECLYYLQHNLKGTDVVLFKASRGMRLETLIEGWINK